MAKMEAALVVFFIGFLSVQSIRIDPPKVYPTGKFISARSRQNIIQNDKRCTENGLFPDPSDPTSYYSCRNGVGQDRKCPEGMKFHPLKYCTLDEVDSHSYSAAVKDDFKCPDDYGTFIYPADCHKYVSCKENVPVIHICPDEQVYMDHVGCIDGKECPKPPKSAMNSQSEVDCHLPPEKGDCKASIERYYFDINTGRCKLFIYGGCGGNGNKFRTKHECELECYPKEHAAGAHICTSANMIVPDYLTCRRYKKCVNYVPKVIECPQGKAFSSKRSGCVDFKDSDCSSNSVLDVIMN